MKKELIEAVKMYLGEKNDKEVSRTILAELNHCIPIEAVSDIRFLQDNRCKCLSTDSGGDCDWCHAYYRVTT